MIPLFKVFKGLQWQVLRAKTPENWCLEDDLFLLGPGNFSGAFAVKTSRGVPVRPVTISW